MNSLLADVRAVYLKEGPAVLLLKILRTVFEPLIGVERARICQYELARRLSYREWSPPEIQLQTNSTTIQSEDGHVFFGFYDHTPFCSRNERVLFNKTSATIGPTTADDTLELCYYNLDSKETITFAETQTWNWQKGCRLHWHPAKEDIVVYNTIVDDSYGSVCLDVRTGEIVEQYHHPIYDTDPNGTYALSVNFSRLERLHYDYGYTNYPDKTSDDPTPDDDGIFRLNLETGDAELLVSYAELAERSDVPNGVHNYVMNLMISPNGELVSVLHRYHHQGERNTELLIVSTETGSIETVQQDGEPSHPFWRSETELLSTVNFWGTERQTKYLLYDVELGTRREIEHAELNVDSHPHISPINSNLFVGDTYPDYCGDRHLYLFDIETMDYRVLGSIYGPVLNETKRDLHPRWDRNGKYICIDVPTSVNSQSISIIEPY